MPENKRIYEDSFKKAHSSAFAQAKKKMPAANASEILKLLVQLFESSDREAALKKLTAEYGEAAAVYAKVFSEDFIKRTIEEALKNSDRTEFQKLAEDSFSETLVKSAKSVMPDISGFTREEKPCAQSKKAASDINRNPSGLPEGFLKEGEYENLY